MKYFIFIIALCMPAYLVRFQVSGIPSSLLEIVIYLALIYGLINLKKAQTNQNLAKLYLPVGLFLLAATISVYISPLKTQALGQLKAFFIDPIIVFWLATAYLKREDVVWLVVGLSGSSLVVAMHTFWQKFSGQVTIDNRVVGIFGYSPNYIALFLGPIAVLLFSYGIELLNKKKTLASFSLIFISLLNFLAIYLSGSRAGLLVVIAGLVIYLLLKFRFFFQKNSVALILLIGVIVTSISLSWFAFRPNFNLSPDLGGRITSSNNIRWQIWETSWELISGQPIFGVGLANFQNAFSSLTKERVNFPEYISPWALTPHNLFLTLWSTVGILGLISFCWLTISLYNFGIKKISLGLSLVLIATLSTLILQGLVDTPYFKNDLSIFFWLVAAFVVLLNKEENLG